MADNELVDPDVQISAHQYTKNGPLGGVITEGYGEHADRKSFKNGYAPWSGWINGIPPLDDAYSVMGDGANAARDFDNLVHGKAFDFTDMLIGLGDELGLFSDILSVTDPFSTVAQWAVSWMLEHVTIFRAGLDMLAGNPDVIAAYSATWGKIADQLNKVGEDFTSTMKSGPGKWSGPAFDKYMRMSTDVAKAIAAAQQVADGLAKIIAALGQLVQGARNLVKQSIAIAVGEAIDAIEALCLDEGQAADGTLAKVAKEASAVAKLLAEVKKATEVIPNAVGLALTAISAIEHAVQSYNGTG